MDRREHELRNHPHIQRTACELISADNRIIHREVFWACFTPDRRAIGFDAVDAYRTWRGMKYGYHIKYHA
jgi:hypothetical protein